MPEVSAAIDGRSKKGSRTWNFRQDRNNFVRGLELRYVRRLEAILEFYSWRSMVILTFVRLIKQGSVIISNYLYLKESLVSRLLIQEKRYFKDYRRIEN